MTGRRQPQGERLPVPRSHLWAPFQLLVWGPPPTYSSKERKFTSYLASPPSLSLKGRTLRPKVICSKIRQKRKKETKREEGGILIHKSLPSCNIFSSTQPWQGKASETIWFPAPTSPAVFLLDGGDRSQVSPGIPRCLLESENLSSKVPWF